MAIVWLGNPYSDDSSLVGSKAATLGRLIKKNRIPPGFVIPADDLGKSSLDNPGCSLYKEITQAYNVLSSISDTHSLGLAVRSSALAEDSGSTSFAGQHDTFLCVLGQRMLIETIIKCKNSVNNSRSSAYREKQHIEGGEFGISVIVQQMIPSEVSGIAFSANPLTRNRREVFINTSWGLGESIANGTVTPDNYVVNKDSLAVISWEISVKETMTIPSLRGPMEADVAQDLKEKSSLSESQVTEIAKLCVSLENEFESNVDIEFAYYKKDLYLLQCRPITTL